MAANEHLHRHQFGRPSWGPRGVNHEEAVRNGFTEGPLFHSTSQPGKILQEGFMAPAAEDWEIDDPGTIEEYDRRYGGTTRPVFVGRSPEEVDGYGTHILAVMVKPGTLREAGFAGGRATKPANVVPLTSTPLPDQT